MIVGAARTTVLALALGACRSGVDTPTPEPPPLEAPAPEGRIAPRLYAPDPATWVVERRREIVARVGGAEHESSDTVNLSLALAVDAPGLTVWAVRGAGIDDRWEVSGGGLAIVRDGLRRQVLTAGDESGATERRGDAGVDLPYRRSIRSVAPGGTVAGSSMAVAGSGAEDVAAAEAACVEVTLAWAPESEPGPGWALQATAIEETYRLCSGVGEVSRSLTTRFPAGSRTIRIAR